MFQVINDPYRSLSGGFGYSLGQGFSKGFNSVLQQHLEDMSLVRSEKMRQLLEEERAQRQADKLRPILQKAGLQEYLADVASVNPGLANQILKSENQRAMGVQEGELFRKLMGGSGGSEPSELAAALGPAGMGQATPTNLKPGDALRYAKYFKDIESSEKANQLRQQQLSQQANQFAATHQLKESEAQTKKETKQQEHIEKLNRPYLEQHEQGVKVASDTKTIAQDMLALLDTGRVGSGWTGALGESELFGLPTKQLQSLETRAYMAKSSELALKLASVGGGVPSSLRIKTAQSIKPNVSQPIGTQRKLLNDIIKGADEVLINDQARQDVLAANDNKQPENIEREIKKRVHAIKKQLSLGLPDPNEYEEGSVWLAEDGSYFKQLSGAWKLIAKPE